MGYHVVVADEVDPTPDRPSVQRALGDAAGLDAVSVNRYEAAPGEPLPLSYHYHDEQEEVFYVLQGTMTVETPDETYRVDADEAFVAEPGNPHRASNPSDAEGTLRVLAVGAPKADDARAYDPEADE